MGTGWELTYELGVVVTVVAVLLSDILTTTLLDEPRRIPVLVTIGIVCYCVVIIGAWCAGAFGIAANRSFYHRRAEQRSGPTYGPAHARQWMTVLALVTFIAGIGWPIGTPIYLAVRKGMFVDEELENRRWRTGGR